jgi:hypothetical protein
MSATSIGDCPTSNTVGFSITPTTYPAGIAARIPIMSFSRLSSEPALLLLATMAVIAKLSLTCVFALPIKTTSMYGLSGTTTMAGGIGDSGTLGYTFADSALKAFAKADRVSAIEFAGIY